jgi:hypothetical protein
VTGLVGWLLYNFELNLIGFRQLIRRIAARHYKGVGARVDALVRLGARAGSVDINLHHFTIALVKVQLTLGTMHRLGSCPLYSCRTVLKGTKGLRQIEDRRGVYRKVAVEEGFVASRIQGLDGVPIIAVRQVSVGFGRLAIVVRLNPILDRTIWR